MFPGGQVGTLRLREPKSLAHTASKWLSWNGNAGLPKVEPKLLHRGTEAEVF